MLLLPAVPVVQHPLDVLARARCLAASALVAFAARSETELLDVAERLAEGVSNALTPLERRALAGDGLDGDDLARLSWQTVSAAVLLWALGRIPDAPPAERPPDARAVVESLLTHPALTGADRLRPVAELRAYASDAAAWTALTRREQLARATGGASPPPDHDLRVDGAALADVDDARLDALTAMSAERLRAAGWLLDRGGRRAAGARCWDVAR